MTRAAPRRRHTALGVLAGATVIAILAWTGGLLWFLSMTSAGPALPAHADGIVALTGGAERVETALRLLVEGKAERLLVSGTGPNTDLRALGARAGINPSDLAGRVTLGHLAASTHGNALETAAWVRATGTSSLIVVTAFYHMPRAMTELIRALPGVELHPCPVGGEGKHAATARLLIEEYSKYLLSVSGMTGLLPSSDALRPVARGRAPPVPFAGELS